MVKKNVMSHKAPTSVRKSGDFSHRNNDLIPQAVQLLCEDLGALLFTHALTLAQRA